MANRYGNFNPKTIGGERWCIHGSFAPNGGSAIDNTQNKGRGFTVARTGAGQYTISLDDIWVDYHSFTHSVQLNAVADIKMQQTGAITQGTASTKTTLVLSALAVATPTDIAANANNRVHFNLWVKNTGSP